MCLNAMDLKREKTEIYNPCLTHPQMVKHRMQPTTKADKTLQTVSKIQGVAMSHFWERLKHNILLMNSSIFKRIVKPFQPGGTKNKYCSQHSQNSQLLYISDLQLFCKYLNSSKRFSRTTYQQVANLHKDNLHMIILNEKPKHHLSTCNIQGPLLSGRAHSLQGKGPSQG